SNPDIQAVTRSEIPRKLTDVVGLYLNPPQQAIVLCVDEKSQIQALQRTQPGLLLKKGRCGTMTSFEQHAQGPDRKKLLAYNKLASFEGLCSEQNEHRRSKNPTRRRADR